MQTTVTRRPPRHRCAATAFGPRPSPGAATHVERPRTSRPPDFAEPLEQRLLFVATVSGIAGWTSLGPSPINQGQVRGMPAQFNPVTGAVNAVAPHPTDPDVLYVAAANGGVWRTRDARADFPSWQPLTDRYPTLSMGDLVFDRTDASANTLYAGIARTSSGGGDGGTGSGILRTTDAGDTWTLLAASGDNSLAGANAESVFAAGNLVLVASRTGAAGVFRSTDGGANFTRVSGAADSGLRPGPVTSLVADPAAPQRFFAGIATEDANGNGILTFAEDLNGNGLLDGGGVSVTNDGGQTWQPVNTGLTGLAAAVRIRLSVFRDAAANVSALYAAMIGATTGQLTGVFRSGNGGANWVAMDTPSTNEGGTTIGIHPRVKPGGQGNLHLSLRADRTNANVVYIGGDRQPIGVGPDGVSGNADDNWPNSVGARDFTGRLFRGDASLPAGTQWQPVTDNGASGSGPHADSRDLEFDAAAQLVEGDDGGVYALINPASAGRVWRSRIGNLAATEFYSVDFNARLNRTLGGTQDVGAPESVLGSVVPGFSQWQDVVAADGGVVFADTTNPNTSYHYYTSQNFQGFQWRSYDNAGTRTATNVITLLVNNAAGKALTSRGFDAAGFTQPYAVNAVDGTRMIIGTRFLYESFDRGNNLLSLGGLSDLRGNGIDEDGDGQGVGNTDPDEFGPAGNVGAVTALAYGGAPGTANANAGLLYVGTAGANPLLVRTGNAGAPAPAVGYRGATPRDIALDPANGNTAYVLDVDGRIWRTSDAGQTAGGWTNVTGDLTFLPGDRRTIAVYRGGGGDVALLAGGQDGVFRAIDPSAFSTWRKFGRGLPHAPVNDLLYDADADLLIAGTFGRGARVVRQASLLLTTPAVVTFTGDDSPETFGLAPHPTIPDYLSVTQAGAEIFDLELSTIDGLVFNGQGGSDRLDSFYTPPDIPVTFNGGPGEDTLVYGGPTIDFVGGDVTFNGGGSVDVVNIDNAVSLVPPGFAYDVDANGVSITNLAGAPGGAVAPAGAPRRRLNFGGIETLNISSSFGNDRFTLPNTVFRVNARGGRGDDTFRVGGGNLGLTFTTQGYFGDEGADTLVVDDSAYPGGTNWVIDGTGVYRETLGIASFSLEGFEGVGLLTGTGRDVIGLEGDIARPLSVDAGPGNDDLVVGFAQTATLTAPATLAGGAGDDNFLWRNGSRNWADLIFGQVSWPVTLDGGTGFNSLAMDETARTNASLEFHPDRIFTREPAPFAFGADLRYDNLGAIGVTLSGGNNPVLVTGVSEDIDAGTQVTILMGGGADAAVLRPRNDAGELTINGNLGIIGGGAADSLTIDDSASTLPIDYSFSNPFGSGTQNVFGLGTRGGLGTATVETIRVNAGGGADTFNLNQFTSGAGLGIDAGGGDDVLQVGDNGLAAVTNLAFFDFDGGAGADTFNLNNQAHAGAWTYTRNAGSIAASSTLGAGYFLTDSNTELVRLNGGPSAETFDINAVPAGSAVQVNGAGASDFLQVAPSSADLDSIRGPVSFDAGPDGGLASVYDAADSTGDTFHLDASSLGASPGDTLFGPGGSLTFAGLADLNPIAVALRVHLGGGSDTAYARPLAEGTALINLNAQDGTGDALTLALAGAANYVVTETGPGAGHVTSDTTGRLNWTGLDSPPLIDDAAPRVIGAWVAGTAWRPAFRDHLQSTGAGDAALGFALSLDGATGPLPWANLDQLSLRFDEDARVGLASLPIPGINVAAYTVSGFSYDPATFTATWTLATPLRADRLTLAPAAGLTDAAGNALPPFALPLDVLPGGADRGGSVTAADLLDVRRRVGRSTASPGAGTAGQYNPFYDLDGSGAIGAVDLMLVRRNLGKRLPGDTTAAIPMTAPIARALRVPFSPRRIMPPGGPRELLASVASPLPVSPFPVAR
jgi:hypothetical protein